MLGKKSSAAFGQDRFVSFKRLGFSPLRIDLPEDQASRFGVIFICFFFKLFEKKWGLIIGRSWGTSRDETVKMISLNWRLWSPCCRAFALQKRHCKPRRREKKTQKEKSSPLRGEYKLTKLSHLSIFFAVHSTLSYRPGSFMQYLCNTSFCQFVIFKARLTALETLKKTSLQQACFFPDSFFLGLSNISDTAAEDYPCLCFLEVVVFLGGFWWDRSCPAGAHEDVKEVQEKHMLLKAKSSPLRIGGTGRGSFPLEFRPRAVSFRDGISCFSHFCIF